MGEEDGMSYRNHRESPQYIIITSQLPVTIPYKDIRVLTVADASLDRIVKPTHPIELPGESVRKLIAKKTNLK